MAEIEITKASEDDADDPRFISAGGDPERLLFISEKERDLTFVAYQLGVPRQIIS